MVRVLAFRKRVLSFAGLGLDFPWNPNLPSPDLSA